MPTAKIEKRLSPKANHIAIMRDVPQKIQLVANVAIVMVAILLGIVVAQRFVLPASSKSDSVTTTPITPGMKLSLSGVDWSKSDRTLLMVLSTNCHFCTESAPFYQRLAQQKVGRLDVRLVAVLPQAVAEAQKYLDDHSIAVDDVRQATPNTVFATGTPTLIIVNRTGSVMNSWVGKLPPEKEAEVISRFLARDSR